MTWIHRGGASLMAAPPELIGGLVESWSWYVGWFGGLLGWLVAWIEVGYVGKLVDLEVWWIHIMKYGMEITDWISIDFQAWPGAMINQQESPNSIKPESFDNGVGGLRRDISFKYEIVKQIQHVNY